MGTLIEKLIQEANDRREANLVALMELAREAIRTDYPGVYALLPETEPEATPDAQIWELPSGRVTFRIRGSKVSIDVDRIGPGREPWARVCVGNSQMGEPGLALLGSLLAKERAETPVPENDEDPPGSR